MNVMLTCAGRRNYLVQYFREALGGTGQVFACDASPYASALQDADTGFVVPRIDNPEYFDILLDICEKHEVRLLFSLNDLELVALAQRRDRFKAIGTLPVIASDDVIETCFDKWATVGFLKDCGLSAPKTYTSLHEAHAAMAQGELHFPVVIKPRWGSASISIEYADDREELDLAYQMVSTRLKRTILSDVSESDPGRAVLIQERLDGQEYGLDVINDLDGKHVVTFVKRKLSMRAGETDRAMTEAHEGLEDVGRTIGENLGHIGNLDCDVFACKAGLYTLELNPRFGGGYPFSHMAGADLPAALIAWARGQGADPDWLKVQPGVSSAKCDILVTHGKEPETATAG